MNPFGIRLRGRHKEEVKAAPKRDEHLDKIMSLCLPDTKLGEELAMSMRYTKPNGDEADLRKTYLQMMEKAREFETQKDETRAHFHYKQAGAFALATYDVDLVVAAFVHLPEYGRINQIPKVAVEKVRNYYDWFKPIQKPDLKAVMDRTVNRI